MKYVKTTDSSIIMKNIIKKIIPPIIITFVKTSKNSLQILNYYPRDIFRYLKYSSTLVQNKSLPNLEAKVIADSHIIEKGLSLKNPRLGFGKKVIERLLSWLELYKKRNYPKDTFAQMFAVSILHKYIEFNKKNDYDVSEFEDKIKSYSNIGIENFAGSRVFKKDKVLKEAKGNFNDLVRNRFSLRQFTAEPVKKELLDKAFELGIYYPSVCNRQSCKAYIVESKEKKEQVLEQQKGTRGFTEFIDKVIIITSDIYSFFGLQERNQPYIDGGIFSMNLMHALSYYGIGACPLNWCAESKRDKILKKMLNIPDSENVILVIGIGNLPDNFITAKSPRKEIKSIIKYV